jgi:hypothetical protein
MVLSWVSFMRDAASIPRWKALLVCHCVISVCNNGVRDNPGALGVGGWGLGYGKMMMFDVLGAQWLQLFPPHLFYIGIVYCLRERNQYVLL